MKVGVSLTQVLTPEVWIPMTSQNDPDGRERRGGRREKACDCYKPKRRIQPGFTTHMIKMNCYRTVYRFMTAYYTTYQFLHCG